MEDEEGELARFEVDAFRRECLLKGLDDIGLTMQHEADIAALRAAVARPCSRWRPKAPATAAPAAGGAGGGGDGR